MSSAIPWVAVPIAIAVAVALLFLFRKRIGGRARWGQSVPARARFVLEILDHALDPRSDVAGAEGMALLSLRIGVVNTGGVPARLIKWTVHAEAADGWFLNPDAPIAIGDARIDPASLIYNRSAHPIEPGATIEGLCLALFRPADIDGDDAVAIRLVAIDDRDARHETEITLTR